MAPQRKAWMGWGAPAMARVAGWDFDHRLNGYITTAADTFSCDCGQKFHTPSGYRKCGNCGRAWNSYVIGTDGHGKEASLEKVICREIPVRKDVIVASKRRRDSGKHDSPFQDMYDQHHIHEDAISHPVPELEPSTYPQQPPKMRREPGQASGEGRHRKQWDPDREQDPFDPRLVGASRRRAKGKCECWEGYERVPGTKPCAEGSCRKCDGHRNAMRYVAWCRQVDRMPNTKGFRRFLTAERMVRLATTPMPEGQHDLDVADINNQVNPYSGEGGSPSQIEPVLDGFGTIGWRGGSKRRRRRADRLRTADPNGEYSPGWNAPRWRFSGEPGDYRFTNSENQQAWENALKAHEYKYSPRGRSWSHPENGQVIPAYPWDGWTPGQPFVSPNPRARTPQTFGEPWTNYTMFKKSDRHTLRRRDLDKIPAEEHDPEDNVTIEHFSSRRRAEIFDITDEGDTPKGKGKNSNTPTMRKNPDDWAGRRQNGQYTNRWN